MLLSFGLIIGGFLLIAGGWRIIRNRFATTHQQFVFLWAGGQCLKTKFEPFDQDEIDAIVQMYEQPNNAPTYVNFIPEDGDYVLIPRKQLLESTFLVKFKRKF